MTTIGIIGSGHVGSSLARAATAYGYDVVLSNSQGPDTLAGLVSELGPRASAATPPEAAAAGDFAIVAIPLTTVDQVPVEPLAGKVVIATINYFPQGLGHVPEIDDGTTTAPGLLQAHLPTSKVVRAFSMIEAADMSGDGHPEGDPKRRALALAGDDPGRQAAGGRAVPRVRLRRAGHRRPRRELADRGRPARVRRPPEPGRAQGERGPGQARRLADDQLALISDSVR